MLDYYVVTSLSEKSSEAQPFRTFYCERVAMYKALDGQQDWRNWRQALLEVLDWWLRLFPEVASKDKAGFRLGQIPTPSQARCRRTTSQLNIAPCEALQAVDRTERLRPPWLWLMLLSAAGAGSSSRRCRRRRTARTTCTGRDQKISLANLRYLKTNQDILNLSRYLKTSLVGSVVYLFKIRYLGICQNISENE